MKKFFKIGLSVLLIVMSVLIPDYKSINVGVSAEPIHNDVPISKTHYVPKLDSQGHFYVPQTIATGNPTASSGSIVTAIDIPVCITMAR